MSVPHRRVPDRARLAGAGVAGIVGFTTVLGFVPAAHADAAAKAKPQPNTAPAGNDSKANKNAATASPRADVTPTYGMQKIRIGVQLKDGSYAPTPAAPDTLTGDTTFTIVETGPNAPAAPDNTTTCTTTDASQDPDTTRTWCSNPQNGPQLARLRRSLAAAKPKLHTQPSPTAAPADELYTVGPGDTVTITQKTVRPNLVIDTSTAVLEPCVADFVIPSDPPVGFCFDNPDQPSGFKSTDFIFDDNGLPPVATDDSGSTSYQHPTTVDVLGNDDTKGAPIKSVTVSSNPGHGTAHVVSTDTGRQVRYTPADGFVGTDSFQYTLTTANGSATATVSVSVAAPPPSATDDSASTTAGTAVVIDVTKNDNPRGRRISKLEIASGPKHGTAHVVAGTDGREIKYTPDAGFVGSDTFHYSITTDGGTASAVVHVDVAAPPPDAVDDSASTQSGNAVTVDVTANDNENGGGALTITAVGTPGHGTVKIVGQTVVYTPDSTYTGSDSFTYTVQNAGGLATATVDITVSGSGNLAETGVDSAGLLGIAGGLLVVGGAASVAGRRRRRGRHAGA